MEIKKIDKWWVIYYRKAELLIVDMYLDLALLRAFRLLRK